MGSLALAAYGAVAGAGAGLTEVGQQAQKEQLLQKQSDIAQAREATLTRLRAAEERKNQQTLQTSSQQFQAGQTQVKLRAASGAAGATRQFEAEQNALLTKSREKIGAGHDFSKEDVAAINAATRGRGTGNGIKPLQSVTQSVYPTDPKTGKPDFTATPHQVRLTYDPNTGNHYAQMGNTFYRANSQTGEPMDGRTGKPFVGGSDNRVSDPDELRALYATPYAIVPAGHANSGLTYAEAYEKENGGLPSQFFSAVNKLSQTHNSVGGTSIRLPSGRMYAVPVGGGTGLGAGDTDSDQQNTQDALPDTPAFQSNAGTSYGNVANE